MQRYRETERSDPVIETLVAKKVELLKRLLVQSQHFVAAEQDSERIFWLKRRTLVFGDLKRVDECIAQRERASGISAYRQEKGALATIKYLLQSIRNNNSASLNRLQAESRDLKREKSQLEKGAKLSTYLFQQKANAPVAPIIRR